MRAFRKLLPFAAVALCFAPMSVAAAVLDVVNVNAPAINCVYKTTCTVTVTDSVGTFTPPGDGGTARLQSRTFVGTAPAPLAGKMAYLYRVDLTSATAPLAVNCVTGIRFTFGPIVKGPYPPGKLKDVYVVTSGGLGSVGVLSAAQGAGGVVVINFTDGGVCPGQTSYFFGLTSSDTMPAPSTATLYYSASAAGSTAIRVP